MKLETLERYIKKTTIPYGDLLKRAEKGKLKVEYGKKGVVYVSDERNKEMILYFENENIYKDNFSCGLIATKYNY